MAVANNCAHSFKMIKSDSTLIQWTCNLCHSGPSWWIFECRYCKCGGHISLLVGADLSIYPASSYDNAKLRKWPSGKLLSATRKFLVDQQLQRAVGSGGNTGPTIQDFSVFIS
ncbi:uncharacterized protein PG986_006134 [Apiospora aurea]|uniref:Uncharacterized protein n=1 Tax=Apiospora aurea TaxID=335848 RepID=A0ABR1QJJ4_9PEZI